MSANGSPGALPPQDLVNERLQLHAAAQMAAWVGRRLLPPADGPIRAALFWDDRHGGILVGAPIGGPTPGHEIRAALAFDPAAILVLEGRDRAVRDRLALDGTTLAGAWAQVTTALAWAGLDAGALSPPPLAQVPGDDLRAGAPFGIDRARSAELGRWFGMAAGLLARQAVVRGLGAEPPCWSHHFDMAVVVRLAGTDEAQVTLGFSPGDEAIPEPYLYVLAWPLPADPASLPEPPGPGRWQLDGWTGLALAGTDLLAGRTAEDPVRLAESFLDRGFEIARSVALAG